MPPMASREVRASAGGRQVSRGRVSSGRSPSAGGEARLEVVPNLALALEDGVVVEVELREGQRVPVRAGAAHVHAVGAHGPGGTAPRGQGDDVVVGDEEVRALLPVHVLENGAAPHVDLDVQLRVAGQLQLQRAVSEAVPRGGLDLHEAVRERAVQVHAAAGVRPGRLGQVLQPERAEELQGVGASAEVAPEEQVREVGDELPARHVHRCFLRVVMLQGHLRQLLAPLAALAPLALPLLALPADPGDDAGGGLDPLPEHVGEEVVARPALREGGLEGLG
mmetsp:Transcript_11611/g.25378  ORF Transcript_11611/g.25378 Transcript_11611/m.25378 type:complete len:279 (+) Transcript_11611:23-859(+)